MRWFIADTHFFHAAVILYDKRPFADVEEMHRTMIDNWNACVKEDDTVYHLGDFGLGREDQLIGVYAQLAGKKILVRGNHDGSEARCKRVGWTFVCDGLLVNLRGNRVQLVHDPDHMDEQSLVVHGHTHRVSRRPGTACVSANITGYRPLSENDIIKRLRSSHV